MTVGALGKDAGRRAGTGKVIRFPVQDISAGDLMEIVALRELLEEAVHRVQERLHAGAQLPPGFHDRWLP